MRHPYVVMVGNLSDGFRAVGPFKDFDDAAGWCFTLEAGTTSWIMTLEPPTKPKRKKK